MNYKSYQQIISLPGSKSCPKATPVKKQDSPIPKRRTKSGCLTCRKRKKKCDEKVDGGKCQACVRNFLDCCWVGETKSSAQDKLEQAVMMISTPTSPVAQKKSGHMTPSKGASAYPSPISSPKVVPVAQSGMIKCFSLSSTKNRVEKPRTKSRQVKPMPEFIVTSFDSRNTLCQIR